MFLFSRYLVLILYTNGAFHVTTRLVATVMDMRVSLKYLSIHLPTKSAPTTWRKHTLNSLIVRFSVLAFDELSTDLLYVKTKSGLLSNPQELFMSWRKAWWLFFHAARVSRYKNHILSFRRCFLQGFTSFKPHSGRDNSNLGDAFAGAMKQRNAAGLLSRPVLQTSRALCQVKQLKSDSIKS